MDQIATTPTSTSPGCPMLPANSFAPMAHQAADHYQQVQAAARTLAALLSPFVPGDRVIVVRLDGKRVSAILDPYAAAAALPPRRQVFVPTESEAKLIRFLAGGDKLGKQCTLELGHFYGRRGVKQRLVDCGIIEQRADGRWGLTDAGEEAFADLGD